MQKPQGGGKFLVQIPRGPRGGMIMDENDTCITWFHRLDVTTLKAVESNASQSQNISQTPCDPAPWVIQ